MPQTAFYTPVSSRIRPAITAITYNTAIIFIFLLIRIHFEQYYKPDTGSRAKSRDHRGKRNCPAQIQLCQNHGRAQFGIRPIKAAIAGWNTVSPSIIAEILSIPSMSIHRFKINVNTNRYKKIFPVWRSAGFTIPAE